MLWSSMPSYLTSPRSSRLHRAPRLSGKVLWPLPGALGKGIGKVTDELDDAFDKATT